MPKNTKPEAQDPADIEAAEVADIEATTDEFNPDPYFASGDARDAMLGVIRSVADWHKFNESQQRDINAAVSNAALVIVQKLAKSLAGSEKEVVHATLEQIVVKDGLKIVLKGPFLADALVALGEAQGHEVLLSFPDVARFDHNRAPALVIPDQPDLIPEGPVGDQDLADAGMSRDERGNITSMDIGPGERARLDALQDSATAELATTAD